MISDLVNSFLEFQSAALAKWAPDQPIEYVSDASIGLAVGVTLFLLLSKGSIAPWNLRRHSIDRARKLAFVYVGILFHAATEEFIWRVILFLVIWYFLGVMFAWLITTLGFSLSHWKRQSTVGTAVHLITGSVFGASVIATNNLITPVIAHGAYNLLAWTATANRRYQLLGSQSKGGVT